jgi:SNF2 family DNA or RNA helicase
MGLGKTVTCLGLILGSIQNGQSRGSSLCGSDDISKCQYLFKRGLLKGSLCNRINCKRHQGSPIEQFIENNDLSGELNLVICPNHICEQWAKEAIRFSKKKLRFVVITTIIQYNTLIEKDLQNLDLIIVSYNFLINKNYLKLKKMGTSRTLNDLQYTRIFFDEIHEITDNKSLLTEIISLSKSSRFNWLITGTPFAKGVENLCTYLDFVVEPEIPNTSETTVTFSRGTLPSTGRTTELMKIKERGFYSKKFLVDFSKLFRRTECESSIVDITYTNYFLDFTREERCIYDSYALHGKTDLFLLQVCCHTELLSSSTKSEIQKCESLEEVRKVIIQFSTKELDEAETKLKKLKVDGRESEIKKQETIVLNCKRTLGYLNNFTENLEECPICMDTIELEKLVTTKCGHEFCLNCIKILLKESHKIRCPTCKTDLIGSQLYKIEGGKLLEGSELGSVNYWVEKTKSTKIGNVVHYIKNLNTDDKVIIFSQWSDMLQKITEILKECDINILHCKGSVYQKNKAIRLFKDNPAYKVICLSSDNAASGANLTEANKIIFLEPIYGELNYRREVESQAISRSYRIGQKRTVEIIRFIINNTVETSLITVPA